MISFDDLVDTGINTEGIENEIRNVKMNTQVNRFSIYDCKYSIQSLSSMITSYSPEQYSSSLASLSSDTSMLNSSMNDIVSSLSSLSSDTLMLYNSLTTMSGGEGFNYWQSYDEHPNQGYNVNERLESALINNAASGVGPAADFFDCTFGNNMYHFTGNEFVSNHNYIHNFVHDLNYLTFSANDFSKCSSINVNAEIFSANSFTEVKCLNITALRQNGGNSISSCSDVNIYYQGTYTLNAESNKRLNICGGAYKSGGLINNDYVNMDVLSMSALNCNNKLNMISCLECVSNTFNDCQLLNLNAYNMSNNTFNSMHDANIRALSLSFMIVTKLYGKCDVSAQNIDWLQINWDAWATSYSSSGSVNVKANSVMGNIAAVEDACVVCDSVKAIGLDHCKKVTVSAKSIASGFWVNGADDLDLWFESIDLPKEDSDIYGLSSIGTLHIHQHSSYMGDTWNYNNNRPLAAFSNGVRCLDFDFKVPTYLIANGGTIWNGAGYGYPGFHISDIYVNGVPYTCYTH